MNFLNTALVRLIIFFLCWIAADLIFDSTYTTIHLRMPSMIWFSVAFYLLLILFFHQVPKNNSSSARSLGPFVGFKINGAFLNSFYGLSRSFLSFVATYETILTSLFLLVAKQEYRLTRRPMPGIWENFGAFFGLLLISPSPSMILMHS